MVVVGDESFTLGFELVGIESKPLKEFENLLQNSQDIGIVVIEKQNYEELSPKIKQKVDTSIKPVVVILSKEDIKGGHLRDAIIKALGVDLLKDKQ